MYFAGTDIIVKLINAPFNVPIINSTFTFPATKLKVRIEEGKLIYATFDGRGVQNPSGWCSDPQYTNKSDCETQGNATTTWTVYATLSNADDEAAINLNAVQLMQALDDMVVYYSTNVVNNTDLDALKIWVADIKKKANMQATFKGGIDKKAKLVDAVGIQINSQQPVSPLYSPSSPYMETYMRSNTMIQGSLVVNYSGDTRNPADTYFKGKPHGNFQSMISNLTFIDDKTLSSLVCYNTLHGRIGRLLQDRLALEITYLRDDWEKYLALNTEEFMSEQGSVTLQLHDVRFISRNHGVSPAADNIVETYQFIARDLV